MRPTIFLFNLHDDFLDQVSLEGRGVIRLRAGVRHGVTPGHHDDHWYGLFFGEQVVENEVRLTHVRPARSGIVVAVEKIDENRGVAEREQHPGVAGEC
jgi:hypothetical protein